MVASHQGKAHVSIPTYNTFTTKDSREIVIAANTEGMWQSLCRVLGRDDLIEDARFVGNAARLANKDDLVPLLQEEISRHPADELYEALVAAGVPSAPINPIDVVFADPQVRHREMVVTAPHRNGGEFVTLGSPVKSEQNPGEEFRSPPGLGGQSQPVLAELGYSQAEIDELARAGVIKVG